MTCIAWDGKTLAADRQSTGGGIKYKASKLVRLPNGEVATGVGTACRILALIDWYRTGAHKSLWPDWQNDSNSDIKLIVAGRKGVMLYEHTPAPVKCLDRFRAWGSGHELAIGAMAMGADAVRAVKIASRFEIGCGMGVSYVRVR